MSFTKNILPYLVQQSRCYSTILSTSPTDKESAQGTVKVEVSVDNCLVTNSMVTIVGNNCTFMHI